MNNFSIQEKNSVENVVSESKVNVLLNCIAFKSTSRDFKSILAPLFEIPTSLTGWLLIHSSLSWVVEDK